MATIEERLQALEQENAARKKAEELLTIAVSALVSKEAFEKLQNTFEKLQNTVEASQEQHGKLFNVLINHDSFTNTQLTELRTQQTEEDGKIVGIQTEMRQRFVEQDSKITTLDGKVVGLQTEMHQGFTGIETALTQILARLPEKSE